MFTAHLKNKKACPRKNHFEIRFYSLLLAFAIFMLMQCSTHPAKIEKIKKAVIEELTIHPKATLIDIYKFFFLGAFGPGHMIKDRQSAVDYLNRELQTAAKFDTLPWQAVGYEKQYYRLNLRLVKNGLICKDSLIEAFVQSANSARPPLSGNGKKSGR